MRLPVLLLLLVALILAGCYAYGPYRYERGIPPMGGTLASAVPPGAVPMLALESVPQNTESYSPIEDNGFLAVRQNPLSTFALDVDTASYSNVRRMLREGQLPPKDAVRIEEFVNYFPYDYTSTTDGQPFAATVEVSDCPWKREHRLVRLAVKGKELQTKERPPCNLVFLIDVSGSMNDPNKLPLVKSALRLLLKKLNKKDRVALVVYAGQSGLVLPSTPCSEKRKVFAALDRLEAGGSTNGGDGIKLAYRTAREQFIQGGINRVILATDGDFNVGITDEGSLIRLIQEEARGGVFLSVLGFGCGNLKDGMMEKLADKGNGNYAYIDTLKEARKVLVEQASGTLVTIAKDVKVQVEFNPALVNSYRLIGYENRLLKAEDFNNDKKDAGEIGTGHTVTALYEVVPSGRGEDGPSVDALKYQKQTEPARQALNGELLHLKLRYKEPDGETSKLVQFPVRDQGTPLAQSSVDFRFAAAVASFGMLLRESPHRGSATLGEVLELASGSKGSDPEGYRAEFLELVRKARELRREEVVKKEKPARRASAPR